MRADWGTAFDEITERLLRELEEWKAQESERAEEKPQASSQNIHTK